MDVAVEDRAQRPPLTSPTRAERLVELIFGPAPPRELPDRVAATLRQHQDQSEILVGWVQMSAVAFFATLYALSPKGFESNVPFEPVPATLAVYALFTAIRLLVAYRRRLPDWFVAVSVVADTAVLMITIWSFHLQYGQPAALSLKAPTLLYVFIIIALRGLRFDPRWVVLAGAAAVVGWIAILVYALIDRPVTEMVTRNFAVYATSHMLLVGAEVDKIVSITLFTAVMAVILVRARRLLVRSVADATAAQELSRYFAPDIARTIVRADHTLQPGLGHERHVAILFVDLRGFTLLSTTMPPSAIVAMLGEYQAIVVETVQRNRGSVITYLGDGIMVAFGATQASDRVAVQALTATRELAERLAQWADDRSSRGLPAPAAGIGVASGHAVCGAIGTEGRLEYAVIGGVVSLAAKLQSKTKSQRARAIIAGTTWDEAQARGVPQDFTLERGECLIDGIDRPVPVAILR